MTLLLRDVLEPGNAVYLKSRRVTDSVYYVLFAACALVNLFFAFKAADPGIGLTGSFSVLLLWLALTEAVVARAIFFPYKRILREQADELYLSERPVLDSERYAKDVMAEPYQTLRKLLVIFSIVLAGIFGASAIGCGIALGVGPESAYRIVLAVVTGIGILCEVAGAVWYNIRVSDFMKQREEARDELRKARPDSIAVPRVRTRDVSVPLQFTGERDKRTYRIGRILMITLVAAALAEFLIPLPILLGEENSAGILAIGLVAVFLIGCAVGAHVLEIVSIRHNLAAQRDDSVESGYRKVLGRLTLGYYRRWGWRFAAALALSVVFAAVLGVLESLGVLVGIDGMPGYFVLLGIPLLLVVLLAYGVDTLSGFRAFKADYVRFSDLLRPGLLPADVKPQK